MTEIEQLQAKVEELQATLQEKENEIQVLTAEKADYTTQIAEFETKVNELEEVNTLKSRKISDLLLNTGSVIDTKKEQGQENTSEDEEMEKIMLKNLNYEVISTDVKFNECTVKLNVSNKDLKTVFGNYMTKVFTLAFSQAFGTMTEEEMNNQLKQYFEEQYDSDSTETITSEITINMKKENGKWTMTCSD